MSLVAKQVFVWMLEGRARVIDGREEAMKSMVVLAGINAHE